MRELHHTLVVSVTDAARRALETSFPSISSAKSMEPRRWDFYFGLTRRELFVFAPEKLRGERRDGARPPLFIFTFTPAACPHRHRMHHLDSPLESH
jgi:hypothetical protein